MQFFVRKECKNTNELNYSYVKQSDNTMFLTKVNCKEWIN